MSFLFFYFSGKCKSLSHIRLFATLWSVYRILLASTLEWVAIPFSRGSSWPKDRTGVSCIASRFFTIWAIREALFYYKYIFNVLVSGIQQGEYVTHNYIHSLLDSDLLFSFNFIWMQFIHVHAHNCIFLTLCHSIGWICNPSIYSLINGH